MIFKNRNKKDYSFQKDAIKNLIRDFSASPRGKFLLVLPTGAGKTITAIETIENLYRKGFFNNKKVLWVVHTLALRKQVDDVLHSDQKYEGFDVLNKNIKNIIDIRMKKEASDVLEGNSSDYALLVIDEAHHSAADGYYSFFQYDKAVLGLTATPSRTDEKEMSFDKISYSISFRDLEEKKVILIPNFIKRNTNKEINITSLSFNDLELDKFNTSGRNSFIAENILSLKRKYDLKKVIVFVGNNEHVKSLYKACAVINEARGCPFKHIGYIFGGNQNEENINNEDYLKKHKQKKDSLLINCRILNEGYDDPNIDAVVMATPTNSMLYYTQCVGRVVRSNENEAKKAYVIEFEDRLPNVLYKIDNQWLYADISDYLEPKVVDLKIWDDLDLKKQIENFFEQSNIKIQNNALIQFNNLKIDEIHSLMFFNAMPDDSEISLWRLLILTSQNKEKYMRIFNIISNNMQKFIEINNADHVLFNVLKIDRDDEFFSNKNFRESFIFSLQKAYKQKSAKKEVDRLIYFIVSKRKANWLIKIWRFFLKIFINNK